MRGEQNSRPAISGLVSPSVTSPTTWLSAGDRLAHPVDGRLRSPRTPAGVGDGILESERLAVVERVLEAVRAERVVEGGNVGVPLRHAAGVAGRVSDGLGRAEPTSSRPPTNSGLSRRCSGRSRRNQPRLDPTIELPIGRH